MPGLKLDPVGDNMPNDWHDFPRLTADLMTTTLAPHMDPKRSFQALILTLHNYWADKGCAVLQPYDMEVGAGTFHPATTLRALGPKPWKAAYVQPRVAPRTAAMARTPTACSIIISIRSS